MKIDVFSHILPKKYLEVLLKKIKPTKDYEMPPRIIKNRVLCQIDDRVKHMNRYSDVLQVLTMTNPPLETVVSAGDAVELARIANDEMAELVAKYPDKFVAAVAHLPMNDMDAALKETDRAITELKFRGVQIFSNINGEPLSAPKFKPLYEKMAQYDLPIWIHPCGNPTSAAAGDLSTNPIGGFGWPFETTGAMGSLVQSGIFQSYPDIKFITHHLGAMVPFFYERIRNYYDRAKGTGIMWKIEDFRKFYGDTALYGNTPALMCGYDFFGADHVLFGTDVPLGSGGTLGTIRAIEQMGIPAEDKEKIFERNAVRLLRLVL